MGSRRRTWDRTCILAWLEEEFCADVLDFGVIRTQSDNGVMHCTGVVLLVIEASRGTFWHGRSDP